MVKTFQDMINYLESDLYLNKFKTVYLLYDKHRILVKLKVSVRIRSHQVIIKVRNLKTMNCIKGKLKNLHLQQNSWMFM